MRKPTNNQELYEVQMQKCRWTVEAGSRQKSGWTGKMSRQTARSEIQSKDCGQMPGRKYKGSYWAHTDKLNLFCNVLDDRMEFHFNGVQTAK